VRAAAGIGLVERQARLSVPPWLHQRRRPGTGPTQNTYVREDQILPHLAAIAILLAGKGTGTAPLTIPAETAALIDQLRASQVVLTYNPDTRILNAGDNGAVAVTVGQNH
jgi:hypothetical protein